MNALKKLVDGLRSRDYKPRHAFATAVLMALTAAPAMAGNAVVVRGAVLPPGCKQVGENRYRSPSSYADTLTFFGKQYKEYPRRTIVNQPGIRAVHIVNDGKGDWEGLNIYELDGETRIFVVPRDSQARTSVEKTSG